MLFNLVLKIQSYSKNIWKDNLLNISIKDFGIGISLNEQEKYLINFIEQIKVEIKIPGGTGLECQF